MRVRGNKAFGAIDHFGIAWQEVFPWMALDYSFLDDEFAKLRRVEERMGKMMAASLYLVDRGGVLGLLGLASYAAQQRAKEIGVRNALGASSRNLLAMLLGEYGMLVGVANAIAWPMAYLSSRRWLEEFAYRAEIPAEAFLAASVTVAILALASVGYHGVRQSWVDPVDFFEKTSKGDKNVASEEPLRAVRTGFAHTRKGILTRRNKPPRHTIPGSMIFLTRAVLQPRVVSPPQRTKPDAVIFSMTVAQMT